MKLFFWDFDETYEPFAVKSLLKKRRDFFDHFYSNRINHLLDYFPDFHHGIITNGNLKKQRELLEETNMEHLFEKELSTSSSDKAKILIENFPPLVLSLFQEVSLSLEIEDNYWKLIKFFYKPSPKMYESVRINSLRNPKDCYVVGTSYRDFLAAKKAGMNSIHIRGWENNGKMNVQNLKHKPTYTINRANMLDGLEKIFEEINAK